MNDRASTAIINYLAIIPARSGSKGIIDKNIQMIGNKTLIQLCVECANAVPEIDGIFFSSDSQQYIDIYKSIASPKDITGTYIRAPQSASDTAPATSYIDDCIRHLRALHIRVNNFIILQVTSPLRSPTDITRAIHAYASHNKTSLIAVSEPWNHPRNCVRYEPIYDDTDNKLGKIAMNDSNDNRNSDAPTRRQDYEKTVCINGSLYIKNVQEYIISGTIKDDNTMLFVTDKLRSIDIDDKDDFLIASMIYGTLNGGADGN